LAHPLNHVYPFASIFGSYYDDPWSFFFPYRRGWYAWGYSYGWGCFFCYYPVFYSTPLVWAYSPFIDYYNHINGVIVDPYTVDVIHDDDTGPVEVNIKI